MGNSPSSASDDHDFPTGSDEAQAAKRNRRLQRQKAKMANTNNTAQYKQPVLHPMASKVVRPQVDSQVVYNHGRVGIPGVGYEHQNFSCICREIAESVGGDQLKLLQLQKQQATVDAVAEFKAAVKQGQHQKLTRDDNVEVDNNTSISPPSAAALAAMKELQLQPGQLAPKGTPGPSNHVSPQSYSPAQPLVGTTSNGLMATSPAQTTPMGTNDVNRGAVKLVSPLQPSTLTNHKTGGASPATNPPPNKTVGESLLRKSPLHPLSAATGRCLICGGVIEDFNENTIPSCSWIDQTMAGSVAVTSMVAAQRNFSESLKAVQSEDQPLVMLSNMTGFDMPTVRALQEVFTKIGDQEGKDNLISAQELCIATGVPPESILGKAMFRLMDITRSNNVNFRTWIVMLSKLSPHATLEDKIQFAFNIYDDNADGFIDRTDLISMLCSVMPDLSKADALALIESIFDQADADGDRRIDFDDYKQLVMNSHAFYEAFTIDIATVLRQHYNVISDDIIAHRVSKLQERDLRQEERASQVNEKESIFMERDHEEVQIVNDLNELDI